MQSAKVEKDLLLCFLHATKCKLVARLPAVGLKTLSHILGEGEVGVPVNGDACK